jgi:hypothetical protein
MRSVFWNVVSSLMIFTCAASGQTSARPEIEAASIKLAAPDARGMYIRKDPGGGVSLTNMSLKELIVIAWRVQPFQISGGPAWLDSIRYDIVAKPEARPKQTEIPEMIQVLLHSAGPIEPSRPASTGCPASALLRPNDDGPESHDGRRRTCCQFDPDAFGPARSYRGRQNRVGGEFQYRCPMDSRRNPGRVAAPRRAGASIGYDSAFPLHRVPGATRS